MAQGDAISAQKLLSLYTEVEAKDAKGYYFLSNLLFSQRSYQRAESMLARALLLHPDYPEALTLQGQLLSMRGQFTSAEEALSKACRLAPEDVPAHFELGKLYDSQHKSAQAVTVFEKVITLNPKDPRAYDYLALNLDAIGNTERAERTYKKGLEVNQGPLNDSFLDYNFGRFLMAQNRLPEARRHLDRAVGLAPKTKAVYYERAKLNLRLKNYAEARRDAEQALSLRDPTGFVLDLQVYSQLATIYARLGEKELAGKYAKLSKETPIPLDGYKMVR
jgi:tetratricopeptide (TPR) repeat protein